MYEYDAELDALIVEGMRIDWDAIVDAYEREEGGDHDD